MSIKSNPEVEYGDPRRLIDDRSLSNSEKLGILENWRSDLVELQVAENENMQNSDPEPGLTAKKLAEVEEVLAVVRERDETGIRSAETLN
jgi:hypothetical protein